MSSKLSAQGTIPSRCGELLMRWCPAVRGSAKSIFTAPSFDVDSVELPEELGLVMPDFPISTFLRSVMKRVY